MTHTRRPGASAPSAWAADWLIERLVDVRGELVRHAGEIMMAVDGLAALPKRSDEIAPAGAAAAGPAVLRDALVPELMPAVALEPLAVERDADETFRRNGEELVTLGRETDFLARQLLFALSRHVVFGEIGFESDMWGVQLLLDKVGPRLRRLGNALWANAAQRA